MGSAEVLSFGALKASPSIEGGACPRCGDGRSRLPKVLASAFGSSPIVRCVRCGTRSTSGEGAVRLLFTCESCGLPFLSAELLPHAEQRCADCASGRPPADLPDPAVAAATETEVRAALARRWLFVSSPSVSGYLDRITRQVAERVEGANVASHVILVDERSQKTLALPSGTLLVSLGMLEFLEDEAELVFVLGHELAHAASGDAAVRLTRLGFQAAVRDRDQSGDAWAEAAEDLVRLGYGRHRERDADARALEAVFALRYDPESVLRYLRRLQSRIAQEEAEVAEIAVAHPHPADRIRRVERAIYGRVHDECVLRVNRELFRRAAGRQALSGQLSPLKLVKAEDRSPRRARMRRALTRVAILAASILVLGAILLGVGFVLNR